MFSLIIDENNLIIFNDIIYFIISKIILFKNDFKLFCQTKIFFFKTKQKLLLFVSETKYQSNLNEIDKSEQKSHELDRKGNYNDWQHDKGNKKKYEKHS